MRENFSGLDKPSRRTMPDKNRTLFPIRYIGETVRFLTQFFRRPLFEG
jgi:hypothetical protein